MDAPQNTGFLSFIYHITHDQGWQKDYAQNTEGVMEAFQLSEAEKETMRELPNHSHRGIELAGHLIQSVNNVYKAANTQLVGW